MDVAELYLSLVRPTGVPVVGECVADGFIGQVQIERWNWNLQNDDEVKKSTEAEKKYRKHEEFLGKQLTSDLQASLLRLNDAAARKKSDEAYFKADKKYFADIETLRSKARGAKDKDRVDLDRQIDEMIKARSEATAEFEKQSQISNENLQRSIDKLSDEHAEDIDRRTEEERKLAEEVKAIEDQMEQRELANKSYEFNFSKRVDFATTQMLNSMKAGDVFPVAILTIHQRSSNAGMSLVFTVNNLRLLDYSLRCDVSETMTDM